MIKIRIEVRWREGRCQPIKGSILEEPGCCGSQPGGFLVETVPQRHEAAKLEASPMHVRADHMTSDIKAVSLMPDDFVRSGIVHLSRSPPNSLASSSTLMVWVG